MSDTENSTVGESKNHRAQELAVGISHFISPQIPGFKCILKQRYTDFIVNEILPNGEVLHLSGPSSDIPRKRKRVNPATDPTGKDIHSPKKLKADESSLDEVKQAHDQPEADTNLPADASQEAQAPTRSLDEIKQNAIDSISREDRTALQEIFGDQTTRSILHLYAAVIAHPQRKPRDQPTVHSAPIAEKSKRTDAHLCIRRIFSSKLETLTMQDQDHVSGPGTVISIKAASPKAASSDGGNGRGPGRDQQRTDWADLGGEYLHFTLYKENKDTMEVLYFLASQLKLHIKHFSFAGTKDRRGVTVQRVAVHRVRRERLEGLAGVMRGWRVGGPWTYHPDGLELGLLRGNEFVITLREARFGGEGDEWSIAQRGEHAKRTLEIAANELATRGFLNYYGLQRFGTHDAGTHTVGMKMLQGDLKGAVHSILAYDPAMLDAEVNTDPPSVPEADEGAAAAGRKHKRLPQDDLSRARAIHAFMQSGSSSEALEHLAGSRFHAEKGIMTHLGKTDRKTGRKPNENDFQGALMQIQRNLRLMYVHAYQSYVWNTAAGLRWDRFGGEVIGGDLVIVGEKEREDEIRNGAGASMRAAEEEVDEDGEPIIHPSASAAANATNGGASAVLGSVAEDPFVRARPLSDTEAASGRFSIFDVVLPLPGYDVVYPENELGQFYKDFMASEAGGGLDPHNMRRAWKDISLSGGYRKVMARPLGSRVETKVVSYATPEEQLAETDLRRIERIENATLAASGSEENKPTSNGEADRPEGSKDKLAVLLTLQLGTSQYATMALRELTKGGAVAFTPDYSMANR